MTQRLCVSVPDDMAKYLEENTDLIPSRILQEGIKQIKDIKETFKQEREHLQLKVTVREEAIQKLNNEIMRLNKLLDENGIVQ